MCREMKPNMILVKNFNLVFVVAIVIISNLIDGYQLNQTPDDRDSSLNNKIKIESPPAHVVVDATRESLKLQTNNNDNNKDPSTSDGGTEQMNSMLEDITDLNDMSPEEKEKLINSIQSMEENSTGTDPVYEQDVSVFS